MKTLLSILGAVGITASAGSSALISTASSEEVKETKVANIDIYHKKIIENFEKELLLTNEKTIEKIILSSFKLINKKIEINSKNFEVFKNKDLVSLLKDEKFESLIQKLYDNKTIVLNNSNEFSFVSRNQFFTAGLTIKMPFYWFGYYKVFLSHELTNTLIDIRTYFNDIIQIPPRLIYFFPELTTLAPAWGADLVFVHDEVYFKNLDHGNGIGFDGLNLTTLFHYWTE